jgi:ribosomal protein S18 acetylase RimI-like enzyme
LGGGLREKFKSFELGMTKEIKIAIKELNRKEEMAAAFSLIQQVRKEINFETYVSNIEEMMRLNNFKMIAAFNGEKIVGVAGYWISLMLYCGRYVQVSNFAVDENSRGLGIGKKILSAIDEIAKKQKCEKVVLDSYVENKKSHSLFFREGFYIRGFHFMKELPVGF